MIVPRIRKLLVGATVALAAALSLSSSAVSATTLDGAAERSPLVITTRADTMTRFAQVTAAEAAGYALASVTSPIEHWLNRAYFNDGDILDPARPEGLVYLETGHGLRLVAAMFVMDRAGQTPPVVRGATWHHHVWCQGTGGIGIPLPGKACPPGTSLQTGPEMLHVWMPGIDIPAFATSMAPSVVCHLGISDQYNGIF